jgi:flotillin
MGFLMMVIGVALIVGPFFAPLSPLAQIVLTGVGIVLTIAGAIIAAITALYRKTSADQAFVCTGMGGSRVIMDGGTFVLPVVHRVVEVNLKTMKLGVNPRGRNALITKDNLRADVLAQFYIRVQADTEHILNAARSLGENSVNAETVEALVSEKLVSALRAIASQMDLFEIHTRRDEFAEKVKEHVKSDLEANGLLLESVTISELDQTDPAELSDINVFDAQGKKKITEITAAAAVERNKLEREAERARKERDVSTRQQVLMLEQQQAEAEANQATEVAKIRADREREAQEAAIAQARAVETAKIAQAQAVQAAEIARAQAVETARVQQERAVQIAALERDRTLQTATVERDQAVALAERAKQIAIAEQEAARAKAEKLYLDAQAERERANQEVVKVQQLSEADREAQKKLIAARQEIERNRIAQQTAAEVEAYARVKQAEADQEAAAKQAAARLELAQADAESKKLVAGGEAAQQMVPVQVDRERVAVRQAEVAVERQQLENRQQFAEAGIQLEVAKLRIAAERDVQVEFAHAMANFLGRGNMTIFGSPETANALLANMAKGMGFRAMLQGFLDDSANGNGSGHDLAGTVRDVVSSFASLGADGGRKSPGIAEIVDALTRDPEARAAVLSALTAPEAPAKPDKAAAEPAPAEPLQRVSHSGTAKRDESKEIKK